MAGRTREELLKIGYTKALQITLEDFGKQCQIGSSFHKNGISRFLLMDEAGRKGYTIEYVGVPIIFAWEVMLDRHRSRYHGTQTGG